jgi:GAF domain-containing protein
VRLSHSWTPQKATRSVSPGYSDTLLGARLLSAVDCVDALTSDRPYRRGLSEAQALAMLVERRGTGYDPDVVDALVRLHQRSPETRQTESAPAAPVLAARDRADTPARRPEAELPDAAAGMAALIDLGRALSSAQGDGAVRAIGNWFERAMPGSTWVVYERRSSDDEVQATVGGGLGWEMIAGRRIPIANRVTGWVVANQVTVANADAALDLEELVHACATPLRCCASTPLVDRGRPLGALTVYSPWEGGFADHHGRMLEAVASAIGALVASGEITGAIGIMPARQFQIAYVPVAHSVS